MSGWHVYGSDGIEKKIASNIVAVNPILTNPTFNGGVSGTAVDIDGTLAANSDTLLVSQKAIRTYTAAQLAAAGSTLFVLAGNNTVNGTGNFASGTLGIPKGSGALQTAHVEFDDTRKVALIGDGQRNRGLNMKGWCPYAMPWGIQLDGATGVTTMDYVNYYQYVLIPVFVPAHMQATSITYFSYCNTGSPNVQFSIFEQAQQTFAGNTGELALKRLGGTGTFAADTNKFIKRQNLSADIYLEPGMYWLAFQNIGNQYVDLPIYLPNQTPTYLQAGWTRYGNNGFATINTDFTINAGQMGGLLNGMPYACIMGKVFGETSRYS